MKRFCLLVPNGEQQSLIPLVAQHSNLVVIRSLTKLFGVAGCVGLCRCAAPAVAALEGVAGSLAREWHRCWLLANGCCHRLRRYEALVRARAALDGNGGAWMQRQLAALPGITPMPSAANYLLIRRTDPWCHCGRHWSNGIAFCCVIAVPLGFG